MQRVHARTTVGILVSVGVNARFHVRFPMPFVPLADRSGYGVVCAVMDKEMQGDGGIGPVDVLILSGVVTGDRVNHAVPFVEFAGGGRNLIGGGMMDGQIERIDLRTSIVILMGIVVGAGLGVGVAIAFCPRIGINRNLRDRGVPGIVDSQMQYHDAVATVAIHERLHIVAGS